MLRQPLSPTLFPYTTLFRSRSVGLHAHRGPRGRLAPGAPADSPPRRPALRDRARQHFIDAVLGARDLPRGHVATALRAFDRKTGFRTRAWSMFAINRVPGHGGRGHAQVF